jgi:DnaK suppressor protein
MDRDVLNHFENLFLEMRKQTLNELKNDSTNTPPVSSGDDADVSLDAREKSLNLKLIGRHSFMLKKIDNALLQIKLGTFGICQECECEIDINRLKARPVATHCIACKEEQERMEGQMLYEARSHTHGRGFTNNVVSINTYKNEQENVFPLNVEQL